MTFTKGNKHGRLSGMDFSRQGRNNRRRGQSGEREVANKLQEALGIEVKRILGQERDSGVDLRVGPFNIDCKRRKKVAGLYEWWNQAHAPNLHPDKSKHGIPTVMVRADGAGWLVVMDLDDWVKLAREEIVSNGL